MVSFMLNSIDFVVAFAAVVVAVLLLLHRLFWPLIQRPLYAVCRYAPLRHKKFMWGVGVTLLFAPCHITINLLKSLLLKL